MKKCRICKLFKPLHRFSIRNKKTGLKRTECKDCLSKKRKQSPNYQVWHKNNKEKVQKNNRTRLLRHNYNMTIEDYEKMSEKQNHKCAISGCEVKLVVDHCHKTNVVRELLCPKCNAGLGCFNDDITLFEKAIEYLKKHKGIL